MALPYDVDDPALARATWSRLAEPDNATAAMVVGRLGPGPALCVLIFIVVGVIAWLGFRQTKTLEEL